MEKQLADGTRPLKDILVDAYVGERTGFVKPENDAVGRRFQLDPLRIVLEWDPELSQHSPKLLQFTHRRQFTIAIVDGSAASSPHNWHVVSRGSTRSDWASSGAPLWSGLAEKPTESVPALHLQHTSPMKNWQTYVRDAAVRALDEGAQRIGDSGERLVHRLAKQWGSLNDDEKRELMEVVVAVGAAVSVAVGAFRESGSKKTKAKKLAAKAGRKVLKKVAASGAKSLKKTKKK